MSDLVCWLLGLFIIHFQIFMECVFPDVALKTFRGFLIVQLRLKMGHTECSSIGICSMNVHRLSLRALFSYVSYSNSSRENNCFNTQQT